MRFTATEEDVDVLFSGYAFRLKILHQKGLNLVKNRHCKTFLISLICQVLPFRVFKLFNSSIAARIDQAKWISSTDRKLFLLSQHSSMINGLRGRYPVYEPVVR